MAKLGLEWKFYVSQAYAYNFKKFKWLLSFTEHLKYTKHCA